MKFDRQLRVQRTMAGLIVMLTAGTLMAAGRTSSSSAAGATDAA